MAKSEDLTSLEPELGRSETGPTLEELGSRLEESGSGELGLESLENGFILSLDVDGPVTETGPTMQPSGGHSPQEMAYNLAEMVERTQQLGGKTVLNSGRPMRWLERLVKNYAEHDSRLEEIDLIGGMGTEFRAGEETHVREMEGSRLYDVQREIYRLAAEERLKINAQNNFSNAVMVDRFEAEGGCSHSRGETMKNPDISDVEETSYLFGEYLSENPQFELVENYDSDVGTRDAVRFDLESDEAMERLVRLMRVEEDFVGLRFEKTDGDYFFYRDENDRDYTEGRIESEEDLEREVMKTVAEAPGDWDKTFHEDGGIEYWNANFCGKGKGMEFYRRNVSGEGLNPEKVPVFHLGDRKGSDDYEIENGYFFPQRDTDAEESEHPRMGEPMETAVELGQNLLYTNAE